MEVDSNPINNIFVLVRFLMRVQVGKRHFYVEISGQTQMNVPPVTGMSIFDPYGTASELAQINPDLQYQATVVSAGVTNWGDCGLVSIISVAHKMGEPGQSFGIDDLRVGRLIFKEIKSGKAFFRFKSAEISSIGKPKSTSTSIPIKAESIDEVIAWLEEVYAEAT